MQPNCQYYRDQKTYTHGWQKKAAAKKTRVLFNNMLKTSSAVVITSAMFRSNQFFKVNSLFRHMKLDLKYITTI